jgi:hypothetical protein
MATLAVKEKNDHGNFVRDKSRQGNNDIADPMGIPNNSL